MTFSGRRCMSGAHGPGCWEQGQRCRPRTLCVGACRISLRVMMSWMLMAEHERHTAAAYTTESPEEMQHEDHFTQIHTRIVARRRSSPKS